MTKICSKCGEEKLATTEYFGKDKANKDGLKGKCKVCISKYMKRYNKQYRQENKEYIKEYSKQYRQENKEYYREKNKQYYQENKEYLKLYARRYHEKNAEHINRYSKQYRQENKEYIKEYDKQYRQENKEHIKECMKQYRQKNEEHIKEWEKRYRQENKESRRQHLQTYRARKRLLPATLTIKQWQQIKDDFNNKCAYCGMTEEEHRKRFNEQLHQEHFIPLFKGGGYTHNNIIPACRSCNSSKQDTDFFEWYPTYEEYNEEREQFILEYLGYIEDTQQLTLESTFTEIQKAPTMR